MHEILFRQHPENPTPHDGGFPDAVCLNEAGFRKLLSPKTGIVRNLGCLPRNPGEPSPHIVSSTLTAFHRFSTNKADFAATGTSLSRDQALRSAAGEAVERYCAALSDFHTLIYGSYDGLTEQGYAALHPDAFTLFTDEQYAVEDFPYAKPREEHTFFWMPGMRLTPEHDGERILIPAALIFNQFQHVGDAVRLCPDIHPGVASGFSRTRVLTDALLEIVERDAMMIHWLNRLPVTGIASDNALEALRRDCGIPPDLELHLAFLETDLEVPCIYALLLDTRNYLLGGGCSASFSTDLAARKAVCEAVQILLLSREVRRGEKGRLALRKGEIAPAFLDPQARKSLPFTSLLRNLGYYLDPSTWDTLEDLRSPGRYIRLRDCERTVSKEDAYSALLSRFIKAGLSPVCVDITTPDVAELGWHVCRVTVPGAVPNTPTSYPPLALERLRTVPNRIGHAVREEYYEIPMPYA